MFLFHAFETAKSQYVYDTSTNQIIHIDRNMYKYLRECERSTCSDDAVNDFLETTETLRRNGYFKPAVFRLGNPIEFYIDDMLQAGISSMILQLTSECNMRCKYCFYSEKYHSTDNYSNAVMSYETIKASLDYFIEHSYSCPQKTIGFYGGEPLIAFDEIQFATRYIKNCCENSIVNFSLTTNATLLEENSIDFFVKNNFMLQISLDGPAEIHNKNRLLKNGMDSYDIVVKKIIYIRNKYPGYFRNNVAINAVFDHSESYDRVLSYFEDSDIFTEIYWKISYVNNYLINDLEFDETQKEINRAEYKNRQLEYFYHKIKDCKFVACRAQTDLFEYTPLEDKLSISYNGFPPLFTRNGNCVPGITRLLVTPQGKFKICEKTSGDDMYTIGDVANGFNLGKIKKLLSTNGTIEEKCKKCWAVRLCDICHAKIDLTNISYAESMASLCGKTISRLSNGLKNICILQELYEEKYV